MTKRSSAPMTTTEMKRKARPVHYLHKGWRTQVYRALYGQPMRPDGKGGPEENETRKLPKEFRGVDAERVFSSINIAHPNLFPPQRLAFLARRVELLKMLYK